MRRRRCATPLATVAALVAASAAAFGSPPASGEAAFDHSGLTRLLVRHVTADGRVDYAALRRDTAALDGYVARLAAAPLDRLDRDGRLALLINAYNAFTLRLVLDHYPLASIRDIPENRRWGYARWNLGGHAVSLDDIEHEMIRPRFDEPRVHFALVCAAVGCPPLRREAYVPERLDEQLADQARYVHAHDRWFRYDPDRNVLRLTRLYEWYASDFETVAAGVPEPAARHDERLRAALAAGRAPEVEWIDYDWSLNDDAEAQRPSD